MKTIIMSFIAVLFATNNLSAQNTKMYTNIEETKDGINKEYTIIDNDTEKPITKYAYKIDADGNRISRSTYVWDQYEGWVGSQKTEYKYDEKNNPISYTYTKWDKRTKDWDNDIKYFTYGEINNNKENTLLSFNN
ncbi:MAG: DUF3836 domain-containing protein [Dysgonomonas sp.]